MTHFDQLLKAAFDAGRDRADSEILWTNLHDGKYVGDVPDFEKWRASLSGLDIADEPIKVGDVVRVVGGSRFFDPIRDEHCKVSHRWVATAAPERAWIISTPKGDYYAPESNLEKVVPG